MEYPVSSLRPTFRELTSLFAESVPYLRELTGSFTELIKNYKNSVHHRDPYDRLRLGLPGATTITLCSMSSFETAYLP